MLPALSWAWFYQQQSSRWDCGTPNEDTALPLRSLGRQPSAKQEGPGLQAGFPCLQGALTAPSRAALSRGPSCRVGMSSTAQDGSTAAGGC